MEVEVMSGAGNIFSVIDNRKYKRSLQWFKDHIELMTLINNHKCEGVMIINESYETDFEVWYLNPDSSSGMMCGNGGRCAVEFAFRNKFIDKTKDVNFKMAEEFYSASIKDNLIELLLPSPIDIEFNKKITLNDIDFYGDYININSDHYVINYDNSYFVHFDFASDEIVKIAAELRHHTEFARGANINYYKRNHDYYLIRTFERGVESITGACGTGACATAISINRTHPAQNPIKLIPPSGEMLIVELIFDSQDKIKNFKLIGPAKKVDSKVI